MLRDDEQLTPSGDGLVVKVSGIWLTHTGTGTDHSPSAWQVALASVLPPPSTANPRSHTNAAMGHAERARVLGRATNVCVCVCVRVCVCKGDVAVQR